MLDFQNDAYNAIKKSIDKLIATIPSAAAYEAAKGDVLADCDPYVRFLMQATSASAETVRGALRELSSDTELFAMLDDGLQALAGYSRQGVKTGEIRIHAHSVYAVARIVKPAKMVETGVANGKSSALILRALERNGSGRLYSIDLPTMQGEAGECDDGLVPTGRTPGWLVPPSLRARWDLRLGDARELLPALNAELGPIDVFFHDSLHTYPHMTFELSLAKGWVRPGGVILCDDTQSNNAFAEASAGLNPAVFGTFGIFQLPPHA